VFLRRFIIIMFEDSVLHPSLPALTWLMIAVSKGFFWELKVLDWVLNVVYQVAALPYRDDWRRVKERKMVTTLFSFFPLICRID